MTTFNDFNPTKTYPCGKKSFLDHFKKKTYIKDLDGNILYEGRGQFQTVLEQAVKEGVELPRADLRNKKFKELKIPNAKLSGASFENSVIMKNPERRSSKSDLSNCDLTGVNFKNTTIDVFADFDESNVKKADFTNCKIVDNYGYGFRKNLFYKTKNFDEAYNVKRKVLEDWKKSQPHIEAERKQQKIDDEVVNPKPALTPSNADYFKATRRGKANLASSPEQNSIIKDLDGNILYEGRGNFLEVLEQAVREGVELPRADLRNKMFKRGLRISGAKLSEASFENSVISAMRIEDVSNISNSDLTGVSFKNTVFKHKTLFQDSDVEKADFANVRFAYEKDLNEFKNFDKAYNIKHKYFESWKEAQPEVEVERKLREKENEIVNPKPSAVNIAQLKAAKDR